jgi:hypothetical protein
MAKRLLTTVLFLLFPILHTAVASAADIRPFISDSGSYRAIVIEGNIEPGDFETFVRIAKENQGKVSGVYIFSPGGDFYEAMKIGRAMRALELSSQVPMRGPAGRPVCENDGFGPKPKSPNNCTCASAGFFITLAQSTEAGHTSQFIAHILQRENSESFPKQMLRRLLMPYKKVHVPICRKWEFPSIFKRTSLEHHRSAL